MTIIRQFFWFCVESEWIEDNPAMIRTPRTCKPEDREDRQRYPFTDDEIARSMVASETYLKDADPWRTRWHGEDIADFIRNIGRGSTEAAQGFGRSHRGVSRIARRHITDEVAHGAVEDLRQIPATACVREVAEPPQVEYIRRLPTFPFRCGVFVDAQRQRKFPLLLLGVQSDYGQIAFIGFGRYDSNSLDTGHRALALLKTVY
jgi:hypothetical protein